MAAVDYFLKLDGIFGEVVDSSHKDEISVDSFSWGLSHTGSFASGGGAGAGKAQFQDFHFTMRTSKASPDIFKKAVSGGHIKSAVLSCRKAGEHSNDFLKFNLTEVLISSYSIGGDGGAVPTDSVSLNFSKIEMVFIGSDQTGKGLPAVQAGFDLKLNKAF